MQRRHFLQSAGILALEPLLFGCDGQETANLRIDLLRGTFPGILAGEFRKFVNTDRVDIKAFAQLAEGLELLAKWQGPPVVDKSWRLPWQSPPDNRPANLISLGDAWLDQAIGKKLLQPLDIGQLPSWKSLADAWRNLGTRDGQIWGAPYRWGCTVLIYRRDRLQQNGIAPPIDWVDLWQPKLRKRVVLLNQRQEIIGLTLKRLGHSYHTDPATVSELLPALRQLHQQTLFYSSDRYVPPLLTGDAWVAVGWSGDVMNLLNRNTDLVMVVPKSGTALWADMWVQPTSAKAAKDAPTVAQWIDFCWQQTPATKISTATNGVSPIFANLTTLPPALQNHPLLNSAACRQSEFLPTLTSSQQQQYQSLWQQMRT
jgi:putative spermidine/putrescine transport system substrate-binding protein